ncbi:ARF-GAP with coiled-coil, ank repeat and ph domain-containing protein 2 [Plakobranchus ocellatus]|uniref:ARF-GAP with coiled-coil, ank repeat and ph domain-containing protein 2 n=1 Tax=Plakobranchus ocellatus TaxID=259542 RepID=A0AAV3ZB04_9GAST|nr:ARF-GAP with coiled-coil, ank repeat and ph domain-containing protein 2 [Plakobranchus ocellatus]
MTLAEGHLQTQIRFAYVTSQIGSGGPVITLFNSYVKFQIDLNFSSIPPGNAEDILNTEGYLFKRNSNAFKNYARRWFCIKDGQLVYRKRSKDNLTVMEEDLRLCTIRPQPDLDRRFCFEVLSPSRRMEQLLAIPGNSRCCDCGVEEPRWASINLGCTLCIECSGIHRSFGVHMSKVRSITLDTWEPEQLKVMLELGNAVVNGIYEGVVDESVAVRAKPDSNRAVREGWIRAKYVDRAFVKKLPSITRANKLSKWSVRKKVRRSPARAAALLKKSTGSSLTKTASLPGDLPSSPGSGDSEKSSPRSKDSPGEDSMLSRSGSAEESLTSDLMEGAGIARHSVESVGRAVMSVSTSMGFSAGGGETGGANISDSGIADTASDTSKTTATNVAAAPTAAEPKGFVFGVEHPKRLKEFNKSLDLESSDDSCQDFDDAEENPDNANASRTSATADGSSGVDCPEDDMTTSWEDMSRLDPHLLLYKACGARNLPVMLQALANKADPNWVNLEDGGRTPIMRAIHTGSMATCEFLLLNNAKSDRKDRHGQTPLHHATVLGHTGQVCQLLKRRANLKAKDNQGRTPLDIAVENANADIVTLLRLAKFDEEMKESDGYLGNPEGDTFQDVFRDFTNMASNNPEKLKRK